MTAPTVYHYTDNTHEYLGDGVARAVPRRQDLPDSDPKKWLVPANATTIAPPDAQAGFARVYTGDAWSGSWAQVEDRRASAVYYTATGQPVTPQDIPLGPLPAGMTLLVPPGTPYDQWDEQSGTWGEDTATRQTMEAEDARLAAIEAQVNSWITAFRNNDVAAIDDYVRNYIDADSATDAASALLAIKRLENGVAALAKILATVVGANYPPGVPR